MIAVTVGERTRHNAVPAVGDPARDVALRVMNGDLIYLSDQWMNAPHALVLVFLRHYGCPLCRDVAVQLQRDTPALRDAGANIVAIGQGTPEDARRFAQELNLSYPILADQDRSAYAAYGLAEGSVGQLFGLPTAKQFFRAIARGHLPGRTIGSVRQLPGTFVIDRNGIVQYSHPGEHAADTPALAAVLDAPLPLSVEHTWAGDRAPSF